MRCRTFEPAGSGCDQSFDCRAIGCEDGVPFNVLPAPHHMPPGAPDIGDDAVRRGEDEAVQQSVALVRAERGGLAVDRDKIGQIAGGDRT